VTFLQSWQHGYPSDRLRSQLMRFQFALRDVCEVQAKKLCLGAVQREVTMLLPRALINRIRCDHGLACPS
jgi:hypothetical protein